MKKIDYYLTIGWLYPDLMSTYGDRGNIIVLSKRCEELGIKADVKRIGLEQDKKEILESDILFMGGAQDKQQEIVNKDLLEKKGNNLKSAIENNVIKVFGGKFNKDRAVNIQRDGIKTLSEYLGEYKRNVGDWLFTTIVGGVQYTGWALRKLVKVISKRAKIKKRAYPHLFRHTIASLLVQKGANLMTVMSLLGHKNYSTTLIYAQFSPQRVAQEYNYFCPIFS